MDEVTDGLNALPPGREMAKEPPCLIHQKVSLAISAGEKIDERVFGQVFGPNLAGVESRGFGQAVILEYSISPKPDAASGAYEAGADVAKGVQIRGYRNVRLD
jgi:hypothetical protein